MNYFKLFFFSTLLSLFFVIIANIFFISSSAVFINPSSDQNDPVNQLNYALTSNGFKTFNIEPRPFQQEIDINLKTGNNVQKIIFSTTKNLFWQASSLQKIQKLAKIRGKYVNFIDLSDSLPYATLQDY